MSEITPAQMDLVMDMIEDGLRAARAIELAKLLDAATQDTGIPREQLRTEFLKRGVAKVRPSKDPIGFVAMKREGEPIHPDELDCDMTDEQYDRQLLAYRAWAEPAGAPEVVENLEDKTIRWKCCGEPASGPSSPHAPTCRHYGVEVGDRFRHPPSYKVHPRSFAELRSNKTESAKDWTPRDALIHLLRDIDSGKDDVDALVICFRTRGSTVGRFVTSSPDIFTTWGMIEHSKIAIWESSRK